MTTMVVVVAVLVLVGEHHVVAFCGEADRVPNRKTMVWAMRE